MIGGGGYEETVSIYWEWTPRPYIEALKSMNINRIMIRLQ